MRTFNFSLLLLFNLVLLQNLVNSLYCGDKNCYDLLQVSSTATQQQIKKAFRKLALKYHPDRVKQQDTTQLFQQINHAYQLLTNSYTRKQYDTYLNNPERLKIQQYYRYYKAVYMPQTNPVVVIIIFLILLSILHYIMRKSMYQSAINNIMQSDLFKRTVNERWDGKKDKDQVRQEVKEQISISGGYQKPKLSQILIFRLIMLPITISKYFYECIRWTYLYRIKKLQYGQFEKNYLTRQRLNLSQSKWNTFNQISKKELIDRKLWVKQNYNNFMDQQRKLQQQQFMNSTKYKQYKRFLKKHN